MNVTATLAKSDVERVGALAIEFWTQLADEEYSRAKKNGNVYNYIAKVSTLLITLLIECIQKVNIDEDSGEDDEFGVALSSGCCLASIALIIGNEIMEPVLTFASNNMNNADWKLRYSSLIALGAITEGPDRQTFMNVIIPGL